MAMVTRRRARPASAMPCSSRTTGRRRRSCRARRRWRMTRPRACRRMPTTPPTRRWRRYSRASAMSADLSPAGFAQDATAVVSPTGSAFGADQEGGTTAFSLAVSAAGVDSGLDTTDGTSIFLFKEGDLVVGRIGGAAGAAAFAVAINSTSGVVSTAQYASLKHPDGTNPDDSVSITESALLAVVTVTDGDGDKATSSTGIGDAVQFQDDGPVAAIVQGAVTVAHDETAGVQADADDTTNPAVAALFGSVANPSSDLSPAGFAQDATPVVSSTGSAFGADQEGGTTAFSLAVSAAGVDSGLDTTDGTSIFLFKEGDLVVGRIGGAAGAAAFAIAINSTSGVVSVAQYASIKHPPPGARDKLHHFRHELKSLVVACDGALNDLSATENCDDEPWNWWIQGLTRIAQEHRLPYGARIVEISEKPSPFVALVGALQEHVPAKDRDEEALAKAICAQRRAG